MLCTKIGINSGNSVAVIVDELIREMLAVNKFTNEAEVQSGLTGETIFSIGGGNVVGSVVAY